MIALQLAIAVLMGQQTVHDADGAIIANYNWRLPATVEALRDVPVQLSDYRKPEERGALYLSYTEETPFRIRKGERFQMTRMFPDGGGCEITFKGKAHRLNDCAWVNLGDNKTDIFKVMSGQIHHPNGK